MGISSRAGGSPAPRIKKGNPWIDEKSVRGFVFPDLTLIAEMTHVEKSKVDSRCGDAGFCIDRWDVECSPQGTDQGTDQSAAQAKKPQVMESMVVTSGRIKEKKEDVTTNITVFTAEDLETLSVSDLSDLMLKEGFMIREYPNSTISVGVRGFRTETHGNDLASHVLILIDGRRAGTGNLAKISMDNVERIEIIRGPGSVQYGASAMGGVINVITKRGRTGSRPLWRAPSAAGSTNGQRRMCPVRFQNLTIPSAPPGPPRVITIRPTAPGITTPDTRARRMWTSMPASPSGRKTGWGSAFPIMPVMRSAAPAT